jgi:pilus assembly protein CpaB
MNKSAPYWIMLFSVAMGLVAVFLAGRWLQRQGGLSVVPVVIAAKDLPVGVRLEPGMLDTLPWPVYSPLKNAFNDKALAENRVLNRPLLKGEPVLEGKLAPAGEKGGLSATLPEGRRAVTVKVNEIVGVAGFALPGNFVDVMVNTQEDHRGPISKILLERIQVLAVAQDLGTDENKPRVVKAVTLEVTPAQAEHLDLARNIGTLSLVLRSQLDAQHVQTSGARTQDLLPGRPQAPQNPAPLADSMPNRSQSGPKLEVIRGLHRTVESSRLTAN